jgi:hypothetical protein
MHCLEYLSKGDSESHHFLFHLTSQEFHEIEDINKII